MEQHIANTLYKVAKHLLLLFCLTQIHIKCDTKSQFRSFALIEYDRKPYQNDEMSRTRDVHTECGAVWISGKSVLTAASCFDKKLNHPKGHSSTKITKTLEETLLEETLKVIPTQEVTEQGVEIFILGKKKLDGYNVIKHPGYERKRDMTIFDLAVMKVRSEDDYPYIAKLCTEFMTSDWVVFAKYERDEMDDLVWYSSVQPSGLPKNHAIAQSEENKAITYFIDPEEQFTIEHNEIHETSNFFKFVGYGRKKVDADNLFGGPVMRSGLTADGCVVGIMNFGAVENGIHYITSTNVTPAVPWIKYVMDHDSSNLKQKLKKLKYWLKKKVRSFSKNAPGKPVPQLSTIAPVTATTQDITTHTPHQRATAKTPKQITKADIGSPYGLVTTFPRFPDHNEFDPHNF